MRGLALALVIAACGSKATPRPAQGPPPPTCAATADHMLTLLEGEPDHTRKIREIFHVRCEKDAWAAEPRACIVSTKSLDEKKGCKAKLTLGQREALDRDLDEADRVARASKIPPNCERYKRMIEQMMTCDKLPQQSRDALRQGFEAMAQGWANIEAMPEEARKAMDDGCKMGVDALQQAVGAICAFSP